MRNHEGQYRAVRCSRMSPSVPGDGRVALYFEHSGGWREIPLEESLRLERRSPTGFEFGYLGSGPIQLSFAILLDKTGDEKYSLASPLDLVFGNTHQFQLPAQIP